MHPRSTQFVLLAHHMKGMSLLRLDSAWPIEEDDHGMPLLQLCTTDSSQHTRVCRASFVEHRYLDSVDIILKLYTFKCLLLAYHTNVSNGSC